jgi:hypothetical protein
VALRWRLQKLRPDHNTSADFRTATLTPMRQVCRPGTLRCKKWARFGAALVALAGRKGSAVHATERHVPPDQRTKRLGPIDERVTASRQELARSDAHAPPGTVGGAHAAALAAKIAACKRRRISCMIKPRIRPSVRQVPSARSAAPPSSAGGTAATMRRRPAGAVRSSRRARAIKAGGDSRAGVMSSGWQRGRRGGGGARW